MDYNKLRQSVRMGAGRKIGIIFIIVALLPAIVYTTYELNSISSTEELIQSIYTKQLDVILFSLNQYALDAVQSWTGEINTILNSAPPSTIDTTVKTFLSRRGSIQNVYFMDSTGQISSSIKRHKKEGISDNQISITSLQNQSPIIERLLRYSSTGYRKIEPVVIGDSISGQGLLFLFVPSSQNPQRAVAGFLINGKSFLTDVLRAKLEQTAGEEFLLAVYDVQNNQIDLSTAPVTIGELRAEKDLWLYPGHRIGIRLKGSSVEDIVKARSARNLFLIAILDLVLIGAVWLMYRTINKEMELVRLKGDFVSNVSHELRTPLSLIRMFTETLSLKRVQTEEKKQEYYETILQETERLTRLINNILNFSRMEAGKKQYHFELISLNDVVGSVMKTYTSHLEHEGFSISVQLANSPLTMQGDREAIAEALINVLDNAIKYSPSEKYIRIATGTTMNSLFLEVEDHGIGIDKHHHKKIFETFYRVSTGLTNNVKGSGLGLSLVKHIVEAHGGTIEIQSESGKGSTFRLLFPGTHQPEMKHQG